MSYSIQEIGFSDLIPLIQFVDLDSFGLSKLIFITMPLSIKGF